MQADAEPTYSQKYSMTKNSLLVTFCPCPALDAGIVEKKVTGFYQDIKYIS
jgi:hypothetical protein